ncbi:hypothetical protein [Phyllobacterium endophyticum]|uniref:hypothetical protein n=1 Tax=Phyllobacterium endophyticum TaxID=1149773 RepID=UPI0011B22096|nr:hypothetical protein [Phyllobacterium endophyticum]MBB3233609.1 hypothetical protein [Phyllobacterium endophyticum]TYR41176.1 hypothetical protein FY050_07605 [Phyllobacterium endophyticum]
MKFTIQCDLAMCGWTSLIDARWIRCADRPGLNSLCDRKCADISAIVRYIGHFKEQFWRKLRQKSLLTTLSFGNTRLTNWHPT